jgi:hypothetical protein
MNEHDRETARFLAERVMGWTKIATNPYVDHTYTPYWIDKDVHRVAFVAAYDPRNNIAQAVDTVEAFGLFDDTDVMISKTHLGDWMVARRGTDGDMYALAINESLSVAICDAIIAMMGGMDA